MSRDDCDCAACRAVKASVLIGIACDDFNAAGARFKAIISRAVSSGVEFDRLEPLVHRTTRVVGSCAATMNAAMDQFEAEQQGGTP